MKKIFTLLFAVGIVSIASAQSRGFDHGKPDAGYTIKSKQFSIQQINREYDFKIAAVKMDRRTSRWEKSKQVRNLENQRNAEIASVQFKFDHDSHHYGDNRFKKDDGHRW